MALKKFKIRWYYDACALESRLSLGEMITNHSKHKIQSISSHLSLGEAYGNCIMKGEEQAEAFIELINKLGDRLKIVGNDNIEKTFKMLKEEFPSLSFTDTVHLATAIKYKCEKLKSIDPHLCTLPSKRINKISQQFGCKNISVSS